MTTVPSDVGPRAGVVRMPHAVGHRRPTRVDAVTGSYRHIGSGGGEGGVGSAGRRAACVPVFATHIDNALAEVRRAKDNMPMLAGLLLPNIPPNSVAPPLWEDHYEPLWRLCEELDVAVHIHGGSGTPDYGEHLAARAMLLIELPWFSHRSVWHLIF